MKRMPWFMMFTEARTDAKLRSLTRDQHYVWFNLLCFSADQEVRGCIPEMPAELLAVEVADGDVDLLVSTVRTLDRLRIAGHTLTGCDKGVTGVTGCDKGVTGVTGCDGHISVTFLNFDKRQQIKPSATAEAARERKRKSRANKGNGEPGGKSHPGHTVSRDVTYKGEVNKKEELASPLPPQVEPKPASAQRGSHQACVETALDLFGDRAADAVSKRRDDLAQKLAGEDGAPHWDCYEAALVEVKRRLGSPGAKPIDDVVTYAVPIAQEWAVVGLPPAPAPGEPTRKAEPPRKRLFNPALDMSAEYREFMRLQNATKVGGAH